MLTQNILGLLIPDSCSFSRRFLFNNSITSYSFFDLFLKICLIGANLLILSSNCLSILISFIENFFPDLIFKIISLKICLLTSVKSFINSLKLFGYGFSWGGFESLALYQNQNHPLKRIHFFRLRLKSVKLLS